MAIKKTTQVGNLIIREKAKRVEDSQSKKIKKVVIDLIDSMHEHNLVGMAAPQIGESVRVFVTEIRKTKLRHVTELDELRIFINPKIITTAKKTVSGWEGCGSVAVGGLFAKVTRPNKLTVQAQNRSGEQFTLEAEGLLARIIQHEIDHLNGKLFIDRADLKTCMSRDEYLKMRSKKS